MTTIDQVQPLRDAFRAADSSVRLQAALRAGTHPHEGFVLVLIEQSAIEPDFFVRDMLTWALIRHPTDLVVPLLLAEVDAGTTQARSQALHTLSKAGDPRGWSAITPELLRDPDDDVARSAWRAAVVLVPEGGEPDLAVTLANCLGRGDREVRLSLSRALLALGEASEGPLHEAAASRDDAVREHALATQRLALDPDAGFEAAVFEAKRLMAITGAPMMGADANR